MSEEVKNNEFTFENPAYRQTYWHTCSHVMAQAVKRLWPEVKLAIGPSIDEGWYYDLDAPFAFTPEHLEKIEAEMRKICKEKLKLERFELPREEALKFMEEKAEPYKVELINDLPADAHISFYKQGEFTDLCAGPHLDSTGRIKGNALKLTACNAAYWRGDSNRETLQRIYGIAFPKKDELDAYLQRIEEAKKRDHRKLGRELGLFMLRDEGPGFPFFLPKGMTLKNTLLDYWRQVHKKYGYVEISTPMMLNRQLWERSGHWDHYKNNMYTTVIDGEDFAIKPMNCPGGMLVYASEPHSYRDLPLRVGELGLVHRHELSGVHQHTAGAVHGLDGVVLVIDDGGVHIVLVVIPVTGLLPEGTVQNHGGGNLHIAVLLVHLTPVVDQGVAQHHALGQEEGEAGAVVGEHEQAKLFTQLPVVTLLCLFNPGKVSIQLILRGEGNAVDTLKHLPLAVAPPISAAGAQQLEAVVLDPAGVIQVRAGAQVGELALGIEGDDGVGGQVFDELHLVGLVLLAHIGDGLFPGLLAADNGQPLLADLLHLALDLGQMLGGEGEGRVKVIVPALVNGGADGQLHLGPQTLHRLSHNVRAAVPVGFPVFGVFKGVQIFFGHWDLPPIHSRGGYKKAHPLKNQGWDTVTCSIPRFHPGCLPKESHSLTP